MGRSELHYAVMDGDLGRARALLASDLDPNHADKKGLTPLHFAAIHEQPQAAELLIAAGARVDLADASRSRPQEPRRTLCARDRTPNRELRREALFRANVSRQRGDYDQPRMAAYSSSPTPWLTHRA